MEIERTDREIIIRIPSNADPIGLQRILDYLKYKEATTSSYTQQEDVDQLAEESKTNWWKRKNH